MEYPAQSCIKNVSQSLKKKKTGFEWIVAAPGKLSAP